MNSLTIHSKFKEYFVEFQNSLEELHELQQRKDTYFIIDKKVYELYKDSMPLFKDFQYSAIDAIESNKTIEVALSICEKIILFPTKRNTILVVIGGGIIQDLSGFIANILYRGIKWLYFPTTLLSACDSCIGGKSSLNFNSYKNLLGSFYPPDRIIIFQDFFKTLSNLDYCSGLGEVLKFNVISGTAGLENIESKIDKLVSRDMKELNEFISTSLRFKKSFIEEDEFDKGRRILLNFAHTFGHAFETSSNYHIPHGLAVTLGMITANDISVQRGLLNDNIANKIKKNCKKIIPIELKKEWFETEKIIEAIKKDKKQTESSIKAILLHSDFSLNIHNDIQTQEIELSIENMYKL